jgi:MoaA/NifB/PqqE/SkfB family radical SAM enzyme
MCRCSTVKGEVLPLGTFRTIAEELLPRAVFVDLRGWGESTILGNFDDYLTIALSYPVQIKLITNGTVNKPDLWRRLGREGILVGVSVDAADPVSFRQLRGGADLERVLSNVRSFSEACRQAQRDPASCLYFCITASLANVETVGDIVRMGLAEGISRFKIEPLWAHGEDPNLLHRAPSVVRQACEDLSRLARETGARIEYSASLLEELTVSEAAHKVCLHPWDYCYVSSRGRLGFCDHLNGRPEYTWYLWGEAPFLELWNRPEMRRLRSEHLNRLGGRRITSCPDCNWCYDRRYMDLEDLIAPEWERYRVMA